NQSRSSGGSQRASSGRFVNTNNVTTPAMMGATPSTMNTHRHPARSNQFTVRSEPETGRPMMFDSGMAAVQEAEQVELVRRRVRQAVDEPGRRRVGRYVGEPAEQPRHDRRADEPGQRRAQTPEDEYPRQHPPRPGAGDADGAGDFQHPVAPEENAGAEADHAVVEPEATL